MHHPNTPPADPTPPAPVTLGQATLFWLKLGFISFGGPAGQIALMHQELVEKRRWLSERRFLHALNYCMVLPGPEAQQLATYIGWLMHKTWGGIVAGVLFVLPSLLMLLGLSWLYMAFGDTPWLAGVFYGIKPAVTALVLQAAQRMASRVLVHPLLWGLAGMALLGMWALQLPFPLIVGLAALLGVVMGRLAPQVFRSPSQTHGPRSGAQPGVALIDDHSPTPAHALFRGSRLGLVLAVGALLWFVPMALLWALLGWAHTLTQMAWFFTKAALLTFGGAYAVLPYVYQAAVHHFGWLSPTQMMDGLALGESTPGPLIMVVAFVAFVGAYGQALFGVDALFLAGTVAAVLVTWFTFLPSFVFILAGGPWVESTHQQLAWTAPLTAISAAVVGVIVNLALFFAHHVFWPQGWRGTFDGLAALIALGAALALMRYKIGVLRVLAACAGLGWLLRWAGV